MLYLCVDKARKNLKSVVWHFLIGFHIYVLHAFTSLLFFIPHNVHMQMFWKFYSDLMLAYVACCNFLRIFWNTWGICSWNHLNNSINGKGDDRNSSRPCHDVFWGSLDMLHLLVQLFYPFDTFLTCAKYYFWLFMPFLEYFCVADSKCLRTS